MKCVKWINIIQVKSQESDEENRHCSSLAVTDQNSLAVVGALPHYFEFEPRNHKSADLLIRWLEDWKERNSDDIKNWT